MRRFGDAAIEDVRRFIELAGTSGSLVLPMQVNSPWKPAIPFTLAPVFEGNPVHYGKGLKDTGANFAKQADRFGDSVKGVVPFHGR